MRRVLVLVLTVAALGSPATAAAHPLGNFTVNRYSGVELSGDRIYVLYVLDMAEIPTFQERQRITDEEVYARRTVGRIGRGLRVTVAGSRVALEPLRHALAFPPGVGGLRTMRLQAVYGSDRLAAGGETPLAVVYEDRNFGSRVGWKEITVRAASGARLLSSSAPELSTSDALLAYPRDLLRSPPDVTQARAWFVPGTVAGAPPSVLTEDALAARAAVRDVEDEGLAKLIGEDDLTPGVILISLAVALFWGAAHALSPGHGKAIVTAYLVGTRGTPRHALLLGLIVTITHTIGVFALGLVTLALSEFIVPEQLYPWLTLVSALLVVGVGAVVLRWRWREWRGHHHHHHHDHIHEPSTRGLVGMGISGGIVPCPTALVVLLAAISLHRVGFGLVLILAFSVGLAAAITVIGLVAVTAKRAFSRMTLEGPAVRALPAVSGVLVLGLGIAMTVRAIPTLT